MVITNYIKEVFLLKAIGIIIEINQSIRIRLSPKGNWIAEKRICSCSNIPGACYWVEIDPEKISVPDDAIKPD